MNGLKTVCLALGLAIGTGIAFDALPRLAYAEPPAPLISGALRSLREARRALDAAPPDKSGHRVRALEATGLAIKELEAAQAGK